MQSTMEDRRKRLAALAKKAGRNTTALTSEEDNNKDVDENDATITTTTTDNKMNKNATLTAAEDKNNIKFRNYTPSDTALEEKNLKEGRSNKRSRDDDNNNDSVVHDENKDETSRAEAPKKSALEQALEQAKEELKAEKSVANDEALTSMAPKKINWDLKRDIQPKLDKLEKRTQKAMVALLRERLAKEADAAAEEEEEDVNNNNEEENLD